MRNPCHQMIEMSIKINGNLRTFQAVYLTLQSSVYTSNHLGISVSQNK